MLRTLGSGTLLVLMLCFLAFALWMADITLEHAGVIHWRGEAMQPFVVTRGWGDGDVDPALILAFLFLSFAVLFGISRRRL